MKQMNPIRHFIHKDIRSRNGKVSEALDKAGTHTWTDWDLEETSEEHDYPTKGDVNFGYWYYKTYPRDARGRSTLNEFTEPMEERKAAKKAFIKEQGIGKNPDTEIHFKRLFK